MSSPFGRLVVVANPRAGRGAMRSELPRAEAVLRSASLDYRVARTEGPGHASRLAAEAVRAGERFIVAAGGDGTVHEVLNGLIENDRPLSGDVILGVLSYGSGCDFVRTFGISCQAVRAARHLIGDATRQIDVGKVTYLQNGAPQVRYFANIAEAGFGGSVTARAARLPPALGPARYFLAVWMILPGFRRAAVRLDTDGTVVQSRLLNVVVANGRWFGGGMHIAPNAKADDGLLDVLAMVGPKTDAFAVMARVYRGRHLPHPNIIERRGKKVTLTGDPPLQIEADGELLGTTPATFETLPLRLALKV